MNKNLLFGLILTITTGQLTMGQTKVYNGSFKSSNFQGNATYNYTEQPDKRIFSGPFTFKTENNSVSIFGNYLNDLKNGVWKCVLTNVANTDIVMKYVISANVSGSFKNGNIDGSWNLSRNKVISFSRSGISNYYQNSLNALSYLFDGKTVDYNKSTTVTEKSTANFNDNHFSGSFSYSVNGGKSIVKGQFNKQGYFDSIWTVNYFQDGILHLQTRTYLNGVLLSIKNKDNSTGEVTTVYDKTIEVNEFFQNYNPSENLSKIEETYYKLTEGKTTERNITFLEDAISIWYNNSSLSKSAYIFEIERGSNKLATYPEREITIDNEKTEEAINEKERIAEEQRALEEVKVEKERKIENERQKKIQEFERSDYGILQESIKNEFSKWLIKTDFESSLDYDNRVKNHSQQKFKSIISEKITKSKEIYNSISARLGDYYPDNESFAVYTNKNTIYVKIPKSFAPTVSNYIVDRQEKYRRNSIRIIPNNLVMSENNWIFNEAIIIFNFVGRYSSCIEDGYSSYKLVINDTNNILYGKCYGDNYYEFEIKDFFKFNGDLSEDIYYIKWNNLNNFTTQSLDFTFEDLKIELPVK